MIGGKFPLQVLSLLRRPPSMNSDRCLIWWWLRRLKMLLAARESLPNPIPMEVSVWELLRPFSRTRIDNELRHICVFPDKGRRSVRLPQGFHISTSFRTYCSQRAAFLAPCKCWSSSGCLRGCILKWRIGQSWLGWCGSRFRVCSGCPPSRLRNRICSISTRIHDD